MSLILEALRKSEAERRRGEAPDVAVELSPLPAPARRGTPAWLWPLIITTALLAVLATWWTTREPASLAQTTSAAATGNAGPPTAEPSVATQSPAAPAIVARESATSAQNAPLPAQAPPKTAPAPPAVVEASAVVDPPPTRRMPPPAPSPAPEGMSGVKLSMHMWNDSPARRFAIINGHRMEEGDRIGDLSLIEIRRDGVLVERSGQQAFIGLP